MGLDEIIGFLMELGLGEYEAKVYVTLSMNGQKKAGDLSRESGVPQSKVYWTLENLIDRNLVEVLDGRPKEYRAVPASRGIRTLINRHEEKLHKMKTSSRNFLKMLKPAATEEGVGGIWTVRGKNWLEFFDKI